MVSPFKIKSIWSIWSQSVTELWQNDTTHVLRHNCWNAEKRWKKHHLQVPLAVFKSSLLEYQRAVQAAKTQFLTNLMSTSHSLWKISHIFLKKIFLQSCPRSCCFSCLPGCLWELWASVFALLNWYGSAYAAYFSLDSIPPLLLKEDFNICVPCLVDRINSLLKSVSQLLSNILSYSPSSKRTTWTLVISNFRCISKLSFREGSL